MTRADPGRTRSTRESAIALWAVGFVLLTFVEAIYRLGRRAVRVVEAGLSPPEWVAFVVVVALFCWGEGHRALQRRFAPTLVARAFDLAGTTRGMLGVSLAPLAALSLIRDDRKTMSRAWLAVGLIVLAVFVVRLMPEPWRGIVDAGVCAALTWGFGAIVVELLRALRAQRTSRRGVHHEEVVRGGEPVVPEADTP